MKTICATAKTHGVALFFGKKSRFDHYPTESKSPSQKPVRYSTAKYHFDALTRKFYRSHRTTDKTTSQEDLMLKVQEEVINHLNARRLYYNLETLNKPVQDSSSVEKYEMNMIQRNMFRRLMYGLSEFSPEQIADLGPRFETKIVRENKLTKQIIQVLKAKKLYRAETNLINAIFQHAPIGELDYEWLTVQVPKEYTMRNIGISTREVVDALIGRKLLPGDYHELSLDQAQL